MTFYSPGLLENCELPNILPLDVLLDLGPLRTPKGTLGFYLSHLLQLKTSRSYGVVGCWPKDFRDNPEAKFPFPFLDLTLRDLELGLCSGTWTRACQFIFS